MRPSGRTLLLSGRFLFGDGGHCGMTKNLPLRKMHFMAQRVRAAGQAMQRKDDCSRPLAQGLCGGIPHDVQDFLRPLAQPAVLSAAGFYDLCAESSCCSGCRPEKRPERDSRSMTGRHGAEWPFPSQRGGIEGCMLQKKEIGGPFRERLSLFGAVCSSPFLTK